MSEWILWTEKDRRRGECPVESGLDVSVRLRGGDTFRDCEPEHWDWGAGGSYSVVAYKVNGGHETKEPDNVSQPEHYTNHPSGIEAIQVTEHMNFNQGKRHEVSVESRAQRQQD